MKMPDLLKPVTLFLGTLGRKQNLHWLILRYLALALTVFLVVGLGSQSYAKMPVEMPSGARIMNFKGGGNEFWLRKGGSDERDKKVVIGKQISSGGALSVPGDGGTSASLAFLGGGKKYKGLIVKAAPSRPSFSNQAMIYNFPCRFKGQYIIAWNANGKRSCAGDNNEGITILRDKGKLFPNGVKSLDGSIKSKNKQNPDDQPSSELSVLPAQGQTLIYTHSSDEVTYKETCRTWQNGNSSGYECSTEPIEGVDIDVFQGDTLIKTEEKPAGTSVKEGQRFTYPGGTVKPIDTNTEANQCPMLEFLNPAYWASPDVPKSLSDDIAVQLKQHREALGVSGRSGNLSPLEQGVIDEMNLVRMNPIAYADLLEKTRKYYKGNRLELPGQIPLITNEGVRAVEEAIRFLRSTSPLPPFSASAGMSRAAKDHANDQGPSGAIGHEDNDGSTSESRLNRYGSWGCQLAENISYGPKTARDVVTQLIIDDGQPDRGHRANIFNPDLQVTGAGCGTHAQYSVMCTIPFAGGYIERT